MPQHRDIVVIGAGAAGLSAAHAAAEAGASVLCIDKLGPGGVLINLGPLHDVPDAAALTGPDLVARLVDAATEAGVELAFGEVERLEGSGPWVVVTADESWIADAVIVATGLAPGSLGLPNEAKFEGRGLSHCAACDGPLYAGQDVLVTGSDRWAIQEAIDLAGIAQNVILLMEPGTAALPVTAALAALPNARVQTGRIVGLEGSDGLERAIIAQDGQTRLASLRGLFVYTDQRPASAIVRGHVDLDDEGYIPVDADCASSAVSIFAAGDVESRAAQTIVAAIDDGKRAGRAAAVWLRERRVAAGAPGAA